MTDENGTTKWQAEKSSSEQIMHFSRAANGNYMITNHASGKVLDMKSTIQGAETIFHSSHNGDSQRFLLESNGDREGYEQEQADLDRKVGALQTQIVQQQESQINVAQFLARVRKYTRVTELTPLMLNELVKMVEVHAPDKSSGKRTQKIVVHFNYVGNLCKLDILPDPPPKENLRKTAEKG